MSMSKKVTVVSSIIFIIIFLYMCFSVNFKNVSSDLISDISGSPVIIIDAGHGDFDGGTTGINGTVEKNINLSISLKLNEIISAYGFKTRMTRLDDTTAADMDMTTIRQKKVSDVKNRLKMIEETENCVFISIHQNHFSSSKYSGAQVFYSKNNAKSIDLAQDIQNSIIANIQSNNTRKIKPSGTEIYLLYHSKVPSVMVECGFLSNSEEEKMLNDQNYQKKIALAVSCGVFEYFKESGE